MVFHDITESKQADEALRASEEKLKKAQHFARVGSWNWNIKTNQLEWSDEMYNIFGIDQEKFTGSLPDVIANAIHPDDRAAVEQSNLSVINEGKPIPLEYRVIWPDGSIHTLWAEAGELILDDNGAPELLSGIVQDITERKQIEDELLRSTRLLNVTQRLTRVGGWQWDVRSQKMYWTEETYHLHGMEPGTVEPGDQLHIERSLECYEPSDREVISQAFQRCIETGEPYDLEFPFTDLQGNKKHIRTTAQAVWEGDTVVEVIGNIMDITPLKKTKGSTD